MKEKTNFVNVETGGAIKNTKEASRDLPPPTRNVRHSNEENFREK